MIARLRNNMLLTSMLVLIVWMTITMCGEIFQAGDEISLTELVSQQIIYALLLAPLFLLVVINLLKWKNLGINFPATVRSLYVLWLPVLYILLMLSISYVKGFPDTQIVMYILFNSLLVGISEELMFRGILFKAAVTRFSMWQAIWFTSIIFGVIHAFNSFITGEVDAALTQSLMAIMSGIWFMAIRIRTGSLIPVMVIHGMWDFSLFTLTFGATASEVEAPSAYMQVLMFSLFLLPLFLYGLFLLRGVAKSEKI